MKYAGERDNDIDTDFFEDQDRYDEGFEDDEDEGETE